MRLVNWGLGKGDSREEGLGEGSEGDGVRSVFNERVRR